MGKLFNILTIADIPGGTVCESAVFKADKVTKKIVEFVYKKYFLSEGESLDRWVDGPDELEDELVLGVPHTIVVRVEKHLVMEHKIPETFGTKVIVAEVNGTTSTKLYWDREMEAFKSDFVGGARGSSKTTAKSMGAMSSMFEEVKEKLDKSVPSHVYEELLGMVRIKDYDGFEKVITKHIEELNKSEEDDSDVEY